MALSPQELERLNALLKTRQGSGFSALSKPTFGQDLAGDLDQTIEGIKSAFGKGKQKLNAALDASVQGEQSSFKGLAQGFGAVAGATSNIIAETVKGAAKAIVPQGVEDAATGAIETVAAPIVQSAPVQAVVEKYNALPEEQKRDLDALLGIGSLAADFAGVGLATKAAKPALNVAKAGAEAAVDATAGAARAVANTASGAVKVAKGAKDLAVVTGEAISRIPSKVATNVAEKTAVRESIKALPTKIAQTAAQDGIDIPDIKTVYSFADAPAKQKRVARELVETAQKFAKGETATDPIEVVGRPIVDRIKTLDSGRQKVGQELGQVAETLGEVTTKEVASPVFNSLKSVPGLTGLKIDKKGILDFSDTVLSTSLTKGDRTAIQKVFMEAVKKGSGKQKHLLRQELFEVLGGKKKNLGATITDTQEKAFEAIRKGLSDVLETKNARYKTLSNQYRKIVEPLKDMRKLMKTIPDVNEDILDMKAGLLARRLTSAAQSNPQVRSILRAMDAATGKKGMTTFNVENLQDLYNILDRYYDIAGKTGFKGQIKDSVKTPSGFFDFVSKVTGSVAGETVAVRQKAIEKIFEEVLKNQ